MIKIFFIFLLILLELIGFGNCEVCTDEDPMCENWSKSGLCASNPYVKENCGSACGFCDGNRNQNRGNTGSVFVAPNLIAKKFDPRGLSPDLQPLSKFLGIWRSDFGGKAKFPSIPVFTYGEEVEFAIGDENPLLPPLINYTAYAFEFDTNEDLHSEHGYLTSKGPNQIELITVMTNGFTTVEEGNFDSGGNQLTFNTKNIARISFGHDLSVTKARRTYTFLSDKELQGKFEMETIADPFREHTLITYHKIFP